jgi:hypothetical protein
MKYFIWSGHELTMGIANRQVFCDTCSIPRVIANALSFMFDNGVKKLAVDGSEIVLLH